MREGGTERNDVSTYIVHTRVWRMEGREGDARLEVARGKKGQSSKNHKTRRFIHFLIHVYIIPCYIIKYSTPDRQQRREFSSRTFPSYSNPMQFLPEAEPRYKKKREHLPPRYFLARTARVAMQSAKGDPTKSKIIRCKQFA